MHAFCDLGKGVAELQPLTPEPSVLGTFHGEILLPDHVGSY